MTPSPTMTSNTHEEERERVARAVPKAMYGGNATGRIRVDGYLDVTALADAILAPHTARIRALEEGRDRLKRALFPDTPPAPDTFSRERLGRLVRHVWIKWAQRQPNPKSSWLVPYDELSEPDKEADRMIGENIAQDIYGKLLQAGGVDVQAAEARASALQAKLNALVAAAEPIVDFIRGSNWVPDDAPLTAGSSMARKQLYARDFRALSAALSDVGEG